MQNNLSKSVAGSDVTVYPVSVYQLILIFLMAENTVSHDNCSST